MIILKKAIIITVASKRLAFFPVDFTFFCLPMIQQMKNETAICGKSEKLEGFSSLLHNYH